MYSIDHRNLKAKIFGDEDLLDIRKFTLRNGEKMVTPSFTAYSLSVILNITLCSTVSGLTSINSRTSTK